MTVRNTGNPQLPTDTVPAGFGVMLISLFAAAIAASTPYWGYELPVGWSTWALARVLVMIVTPLVIERVGLRRVLFVTGLVALGVRAALLMGAELRDTLAFVDGIAVAALWIGCVVGAIRCGSRSRGAAVLGIAVVTIAFQLGGALRGRVGDQPAMLVFPLLCVAWIAWVRLPAAQRGSQRPDASLARAGVLAAASLTGVVLAIAARDRRTAVVGVIAAATLGGAELARALFPQPIGWTFDPMRSIILPPRAPIAFAAALILAGGMLLPRAHRTHERHGTSDTTSKR